MTLPTHPWLITVFLSVFICVLSIFYQRSRRRKVNGFQSDIFAENHLHQEGEEENKPGIGVHGLPMEEIPGPKPSPGLGNLGDIAAAGNYYAFLTKIHQKYGIIAKFFVGDKLLVSLADPELFRKTARTSNRPAELFEAFSPLMTKDSLAFINGPEGRRRHNAFETAVSHQAIPNYIKGLQMVSDELLERWKTFDSGSKVSIKMYTLPLAMKCVLQQFYGDYFYKHEDLIIPMQENFDFCWYDLERRSMGDVPEENSERQEEFMRRRNEIFAVIGDMVQERKANPPEPGDEKLIDAVMNYIGDDEQTIVADLVNIIVGAYISSGDILTWVFYFLAKHQDVQQKLYDELLDVLGEERLSFDAIPHLKYLKQIIDESLRASLLGTFVAREAETDMLLAGFHIPPGVPIVQAMGVVHMDPRYFPNPKRFDPERFSEENKKLRPAYAFVPFGFAGGRKCLGFRFTYLVCMELLSTIIKTHKISCVPGQADPEIVFGVISCMKGDIDILIEKRRRG